MSDATVGRVVVQVNETTFKPYDRYGVVEPGMHWQPLNYSRDLGSGTFLLQLDPGTKTMPHVHEDLEEIFIISGDLVEDDGKQFGPGDHISYHPGSKHFSTTRGGCLMLSSVKSLSRLSRDEQ